MRALAPTHEAPSFYTVTTDLPPRAAASFTALARWLVLVGIATYAATSLCLDLVQAVLR